MTEPRTLSKAEIGLIIAKWAERLRLQDWTILFDIKRASDMALEGKEATISRQYPNRIVWITLMDPVDYPKDCALPQDHEINIVHEMLHIYTGYFDLPTKGAMHIWEEQMIGAIAHALVALDRSDEQARVARHLFECLVEDGGSDPMSLAGYAQLHNWLTDRSDDDLHRWIRRHQRSRT